MLLSIVPLLFSNSAAALALPESSSLTSRNAYPFSHMVAYGDELSDNGNGSYAHGITGNPATVYGYGTWTDGPVAVSYLTDLLQVPLTDYAFGASDGGSNFGGTVDNAYTSSPSSAQSLEEQIRNYTSHGAPNIQSSLQFIWIGENDLSEHTDAFWGGDWHNGWFAGNISGYIAGSVHKLLNAGAPYVFVANIYPKHIAPVTKKYLCSDGSCVATWGQVIQQANAAIQFELAQFGSQVIYYDVFDFMVNLANNGAAYGITQPTSYYCDGDASDLNEKWDECQVQGLAHEFYWMSFVNPTTHVHQLIAGDMKSAIDQHFGM